MFLRLGITNALRNLARSLLAILSMTVAASFLSYSVSLEKGYAGGAGQFVRRMQNGEIIAYAEKLSLEMPKVGEHWVFEDEPLSDFTDYELYYPEYSNTGYLRLAERNNYFTTEDLAALNEIAGICTINPILRFPAWLNTQMQVSVVGRETQGIDTKEHAMEEYLIDGHWFSGEESDLNSVVISQYIPGSETQYKVGDTIELTVPRFSRIENRLHAQWFKEETIELKVIGIVAIPTRYISYINSATGLTSAEQIYGYSSEIYVSKTLWWNLWNRASDQTPYYPEQLSLQTENLTYLEDIVYDLGNLFPHFQFVSAPKAEERLLSNFSLEPEIAFRNLPLKLSLDLKNQAIREQQAVISADLRLPILILILFNAALLVAANILIMVTERKREMAILKAIGAMRKNIIAMVLAEAVMVTFLGGSLGFLLVEVQSILNQITNRNPFFVILSNVMRSYGIVVGSTAIIAIFFGLLPAIKSASMSVMGVLRDE